MEKITSRLMELAAIWLDQPIEITRDDKVIPRAVRIKEGDLVRVENGKLVQTGLANHRIRRCIGNITSAFLMFEAEDIISGDRIIINLK